MSLTDDMDDIEVLSGPDGVILLVKNTQFQLSDQEAKELQETLHEVRTEDIENDSGPELDSAGGRSGYRLEGADPEDVGLTPLDGEDDTGQ